MSPRSRHAFDGLLGPRPDPQHALLPEACRAWVQKLAKLDQELAAALGNPLPLNPSIAEGGSGEIAQAVAKAHREYSHAGNAGVQKYVPSKRLTFDLLLLDPGPQALASVYFLGGRPAIHKLASHRIETVVFLHCGLCPGPDVDEPRLRCGHPIDERPCPRHPHFKPPVLWSELP